MNGAASYLYDFENHLVQAGSGVTMVYDGDGNRVKKTAGGQTTTYLVDTQNPTGYAQVVFETWSGGSGSNRELSHMYVYGLERISQFRSFLASNQSQTQTSYYAYDGHGSVRALTDPNGAVTDTYDYDAFGNLLHSTGTTSNEFLFAGEQFDSDLNLYYNRARYLNASTGRFLTMDSFQGDPNSPISLHKYLYASLDPPDRVDPSGRFDLGEALTVAYVATINFAASVPYLLPIAGGIFASVNVGLFVANDEYGAAIAASPDIQHALYEDVALLFNYGGQLADAVFVAARGGVQSREIILDLFGGASSQIPGAINIDLRAAAGVRASVSDLPFASESVDKIVASGPQADFLDEAARVLKPGGRLYINYTIRNPFGRVDEASLDVLRLRPISIGGPLDPQFSNLSFALTNGTPIPSSSVLTTILEKY